jgi:ABC-2 type transport system permease protein
MSGLWLVARREITMRIHTKGFIISLLVSALLVGALAFAPKLFAGPDSYAVGFAESASLQPALTAVAKDVEIIARDFPDEATARKAVLDGDVDAVVLGNRQILADGELDRQLGVLLQAAHQTVQAQQQVLAAGLDPAKVDQALRVTPLEQVSVGADSRYAAARIGIASLLVMLLFFLLLYPSMYVAIGVVEEKGSRIVEILLTSLRPWQLLGGKVLGLGLLALTHLVVICAVGFGASAVSGLAVDLPPGMPGIVLSTLVGFFLGYAFFAAMAAALGSLVSRQEEVSSVLTPMMLLMMLSYGVAFLAVSQPAGVLARTLSLIPPFSSMIMPVRVAAGKVEIWETALACGLMVVATVGVLLLGARVYQRAVLLMGVRVKLFDVVR